MGTVPEPVQTGPGRWAERHRVGAARRLAEAEARKALEGLVLKLLRAGERRGRGQAVGGEQPVYAIRLVAADSPTAVAPGGAGPVTCRQPVSVTFGAPRGRRPPGGSGSWKE
ncbi:hypothetical protein [Streptomyces sp. NPDC000410]|uniref:hypothetical protein n=1 Tax=Streptomyces sp. NPDC000410 TaxID=3154254 RepID=UPI00331E8520